MRISEWAALLQGILARAPQSRRPFWARVLPTRIDFVAQRPLKQLPRKMGILEVRAKRRDFEYRL